MRSLLILAMLLTACGDDHPRYPPGGGGGVPPSGHGTVSPPRDAGAGDGGSGDAGSTPTEHACGAGSYLCPEGQSANCCADIFTACPEDYPYFCPSANQCMFDPEPCADPETCSYRGLPCQ